MREPKVTLLTWTNHPLETVYAVWKASKDEEPLMSVDEIAEKYSSAEIEKLFGAVIAQRIPIGEHIDFVFMLENVSVSWREQAVRHRIGTTISPERMGVDILPNLAESSFWSQSMRIQNMGKFATDKKYRVPHSIVNNPTLVREYTHAMNNAQDFYNTLVKAGVPMEDARDVIPLGAQHRISWKLNMGALQHILGKRGCWILQLGIWGPVITGMVGELVKKVHPIFADLVCPPCIKDDEFTGCTYMEECRRRLTGQDQLPPCPLHLNYHLQPADIEPMPTDSIMLERAEQYRKFWRRNPFTGERITLETDQ